MTNRLVSFSGDFKQIYYSLDKSERDRIDAALASLSPILKEMQRTDFHFNRNLIRFDVGGVWCILHVYIYDNPLRAIVRKMTKK